MAAAVAPADLKTRQSVNQTPAQRCFGCCTVGATSIHGRACAHADPTQRRWGKMRPIWKQQQERYTPCTDRSSGLRAVSALFKVIWASPAGCCTAMPAYSELRQALQYAPLSTHLLGVYATPPLGKAREGGELDGHTNEKPGWRVSTFVHTVLILLLHLNPSTFGIPAMYHQKP